MSPERILLTRAGAANLQAELRRLKSEDRPKVIEAIAEARSHGDLSENAEYDAAKEQQRFIEGRIAELESALSSAEVINPADIGRDGAVVFGAHIELYDEHGDCEISYQLVGNLEADLEQGRLSVQSPLGRALLGKREGDEIEFDAPAGKRVYEVLKVRYA